jgi:hypothetical protein
VLVQLAAFAALAVVCLIGWRVEVARAKAWQVDPNKTIPRSVVKLFAVGPGPWVLLGTSQETSYEHVSASPEVEASGFELRDETGSVFSVAKGTKLQIRSMDGARRAPVDAITSGGVVRPRFTLEVSPDHPLYALKPSEKRSATAYRGGALPALGGGGKPFVLAGEPGAVVGGLFPGCWLLLLGPFVGGGVALALLGLTGPSWVVASIATVLMLFGWIALPERPPA